MRALATALLALGLIARQEASVPSDPQKLAAWLEADRDVNRVWQAIAALSKNPTLPEGTEMVLARHLIATVAPSELEQNLALNPLFQDAALRIVGDALLQSTAPWTEALEDYLARTGRARIERLGRRGEWKREEVEGVLNLLLLDPPRFVAEEKFRARVLEVLPHASASTVPKELGDALLVALNSLPGVDFAASERIESGWGAIPRRSLDREMPFGPSTSTFADDVRGPIEASIYSLPSRFFDAETAGRFLEGVRRVAPGRTLVVLTDLPMRTALSERARGLNIELIETYGRRYTPWPRDPFSLLRRRDGGVLVLVRPGSQPRRPEDNFMGLELVQGLPASLDAAWGDVRWAKAPVFFHNGQMLMTEKSVWISLHTLEPRILQLMGLKEVPVSTFGTREGWKAYVRAARTAVGELGSLCGREVRFVHPLPETGEISHRLGDGAGFDLDSILTFVEGHALVADVEAGKNLITRLSSRDLDAFKTGYGLEGATEAIRMSLLDAERTPRARALADFTDLVAEHLEREGLVVERLPLLFVPVGLLRDRAGLDDEDFLVTWNNVVLERSAGVLRAEGFASFLETGDVEARRVFSNSGCRLDLLPSLPRSVLLLGGYRCASQHLRPR